MRNTKKIFFTFIIFFTTIALAGRKFIMHVTALETPNCGDVNAKKDEDVNCRIEISNSHFEQLTSAHLNINIPNNVTFVVTDEDWTCTSTVNSVVCDKTYAVAFPLGTFDYVDVSFGSGYVGKYDISSTVSGSGTNTIDITYNDSVDVPYFIQWCGDGDCTGSIEDCGSCSADCGECGPVCGDGECTGGEDCESCSEDCGECVPICGDGICTWPEEDVESCPQDCNSWGV